MFANPALLGSVEGKAVNLNYMNYMEGANLASASFATLFGEKGTIGVMAQYINYGTMKQMDENHVQTGEFSAKDISVAGALSYDFWYFAQCIDNVIETGGVFKVESDVCARFISNFFRINDKL